MQLIKRKQASVSPFRELDVKPACCEKQRNGVDQEPSFSLALAGEGEKVRIYCCRGGGLLRERLLSMGIHIDDEIKVVQKQNGGAMLIEKMGSRFALGGGMAHKINVTRC
jgi:ferrous iron transport protein A